MQSSTTPTATQQTNDDSDGGGYDNTDEAANRVAEAFGMLFAGAVLEKAAEDRQAQLIQQREEEERTQALKFALLLREQEKQRREAEVLRRLFGL
jgi:hypothetical protein